MRRVLWPDAPGDHEKEIDAFLANRSALIRAVFVCEDDARSVIGFLELSLRNYAEGSPHPAVPYIEGWYVDPGYRGRGAGAALIAAAERWAREQGYSELASDAEIDNDASIAAHRALGFEVRDRIVCFLKRL
jgi:aminoglycoside 6'-N-acetyltransferase I